MKRYRQRIEGTFTASPTNSSDRVLTIEPRRHGQRAVLLEDACAPMTYLVMIPFGFGNGPTIILTQMTKPSPFKDYRTGYYVVRRKKVMELPGGIQTLPPDTI